MSIKVFPLGSQEITVPAGAKIAAFSSSPAQIYIKYSTPNQPDKFVLFKSLNANEDYASATQTNATTFRIDAGADQVLVNYGTAAVVVERRAYQGQPAVVALDVTGPLTAAAILSGIVTSTTAAAVNGTVPTATVLDASVLMVAVESVDFTVIATGANAFTVVVAAGVTAVGSLVVATATSGRFRLTKTGAGAYVIYRLS